MKHTVTLGGVSYSVKVIDGIRYINNIPSDKFVEKLWEQQKWDVISDLIKIAFKNDITFDSPQQEANMLHASRTKQN